MENQGLNKIVCFLVKNFNATLFFLFTHTISTKRARQNVNIIMSRNEKSLCKRENISGKLALGEVS
jgi:hypothetical protein